MLTQLKKMQSQAGNHQVKLEEIVQNLADGSDELDSLKVTAGCTGNSSKVLKYDADLFGQDPDSSEAIEFLCLAEGGEVTHYEVLVAMSKKLNGKMKNSKKLSTTVNSILREEKRHLALCTKIAKQTAIS